MLLQHSHLQRMPRLSADVSVGIALGADHYPQASKPDPERRRMHRRVLPTVVKRVDRIRLSCFHI